MVLGLDQHSSRDSAHGLRVRANRWISLIVMQTASLAGRTDPRDARRVNQTHAPAPQSLRQRVLAELRAMSERGLTVVPEQATVRGKTVPGVIVTDNRGQRFRALESTGKLTLEHDTTPRESTPTWVRVESTPATLRSVIGAMLDAMRR